MTRPTLTRIFLGLFILAFTIVACNNKSSENKESTMDTTTKMAPKMDTGMQKMDTGSTKPVNPGN
jgi:hypothetical protein